MWLTRSLLLSRASSSCAHCTKSATVLVEKHSNLQMVRSGGNLETSEARMRMHLAALQDRVYVVVGIKVASCWCGTIRLQNSGALRLEFCTRQNQQIPTGMAVSTCVSLNRFDVRKDGL